MPTTVTAVFPALRYYFLVAIASVLVVLVVLVVPVTTLRESGYPGLNPRNPSVKKANNLSEEEDDDASIRSHFARPNPAVQQRLRVHEQTKTSLRVLDSAM